MHVLAIIPSVIDVLKVLQALLLLVFLAGVLLIR